MNRTRHEQPLYVFFGHHKCATMTLNTIVTSVCRRLGLRFRAEFDENQFDGKIRDFIRHNKVEFLAYGNADIAYARGLPAHRGFHIIRDPRDIVVSAYFSHIYSHSTTKWEKLREHRERLRKLPVEEGIAEEIRFRKRSFEHMHSWDYCQENVLEIRFEEFIQRNYETLIRVFSFLGLLDEDHYRFSSRLQSAYRQIAAQANKKLRWSLPGRFTRQITTPEILTITWRNSFEAKTRGRSTGDEDIQSHYRKGKSGDWREYFNEDHKKQFKQLYPGLVPQLHYHADDSW